MTNKLTDRLRGIYEVEFWTRPSADFIPPIAIEAADRIEALEKELSAFNNPKNWTRPHNHEGQLISEHALYRPKLLSIRENPRWHRTQ